jgi:dynein heavy chain
VLLPALQVEKYMNDIVSKMRGELRDVLRDSVTDYTAKPRDKWLFDWPSQIILVVNQIFWCQEVEQVRGPSDLPLTMACTKCSK